MARLFYDYDEKGNEYIGTNIEGFESIYQPYIGGKESDFRDFSVKYENSENKKSGSNNSVTSAPVVENSNVDAYAAYLKVLQDQQARLLAMLNRQADMARDSVNDAYNDSAKKQYVSNEQAKVNLNQQSKLLGVGGLTESANLELETGYHQGLNDLYKKKIEALAQIDMDLMSQKIDSANKYYDNLFNSAMKDSDFLNALVLTQDNAKSVAQKSEGIAKPISLINNGYQQYSTIDEYKNYVNDLRNNGYSESNIVAGLQNKGVSSDDMHKILR